MDKDPRAQDEYPDEPAYEDGAFHIELAGDAWGVYDAFDNRIWLYFPTDTEAIDAIERLAAAASEGYAALEAAYVIQSAAARAAMRHASE